MKKPKKLLAIVLALAGVLLGGKGQEHDFSVIISKGERPALAVPDLRGDAQAQGFMAALNSTLWSDLEGGGIFKMVPKTLYPTTVPQQPSDFRMPPPLNNTPPARGRKAQPPPPQSGGGLWMADWSGPPPQATYLVMGYTAVQNGLFVLRGWLIDLRRDTPANAQVLGKTYIEPLDEAGARKGAHEFAADILALFGTKSLFGSHIYFVRQQGQNKEIWVMDADGKNQTPVTHYNSLSIQPAISPDGSRLAFTSYVHGNPGIFVFSVDPIRDLGFYNQRGASVTATPSFTPDGKQIIFASSSGSGHCCRIYLANLDGSDVDRLSDGTGEASNPAWHPDGQTLAFSWTRGFATGAFNVFIMDVAIRHPTQLTHGEGRNENPSWAPDGKHIAFMSTRSGRSQIWSMLADGTQLQQLTTQGSNLSPVWGK